MAIDSRMTFFPTPEDLVPQTDYLDRRASPTSELTDTFRRRAIGERALEEIKATFLSIRGEHTPTVLSALTQGNGFAQSVAEIEARLSGHEDSTDIPTTLDLLARIGLVESQDDSGVQRFNIVAPEA